MHIVDENKDTKNDMYIPYVVRKHRSVRDIILQEHKHQPKILLVIKYVY